MSDRAVVDQMLRCRRCGERFVWRDRRGTRATHCSPCRAIRAAERYCTLHKTTYTPMAAPTNGCPWCWRWWDGKRRYAASMAPLPEGNRA